MCPLFRSCLYNLIRLFELLQIEKRLVEACSGKVFVNSRKCQALLDEQEKLRIKSAQAKVLKDEIVIDIKKYKVAKQLASIRYAKLVFLIELSSRHPKSGLI